MHIFEQRQKFLFIYAIFVFILGSPNGCQSSRSKIISGPEEFGKPLNQVIGELSQEHVNNCEEDGSSLTKEVTFRITIGDSVRWSVKDEIGSSEMLNAIIAELNLNDAIAASYGQTYQISREVSKSIPLFANPGERLDYIVEWKEVWQPGRVVIEYQGEPLELEYQYRKAITPDIRNQIRLDCNIASAPDEPNTSTRLQVEGVGIAPDGQTNSTLRRRMALQAAEIDANRKLTEWAAGIELDAVTISENDTSTEDTIRQIITGEVPSFVRIAERYDDETGIGYVTLEIPVAIDTKISVQTPSIEEIVNSEVDKLKDGTIGFTPPTRMTAGTLATIIVSISKNTGEQAERNIVEDIAEKRQDDGIEGFTAPVTREIQVSSKMRASLIADPEDFKIIDLQESAEQLVGQRELTSWLWNVTPLRAGPNKQLILSVDAIVLVRYPESDEFVEEEKSVRVLKEVIDVRINPTYTASLIWKNYWQLLIIAILLPLLGWLLNRLELFPRIVVNQINRDRNAQMLQSALLDAYGSESDLRQMVQFELNQNLDEIAGGSDLAERTFNLIMWARQFGYTDELLTAAYNGNPNNPKIKALILESRGELPQS